MAWDSCYAPIIEQAQEEFECIGYRKNAANQRKQETSRTACNPPQNIIIAACLDQITQVLPLMSEIGGRLWEEEVRLEQMLSEL